MQNTSQTFRGTAAPGVTYSEHSYDNHISGPCQSSGYQQPYSNQVYHPRPHHYGNHQMQQNMPYRHHGGGAYAPNQNQYGPMNQDVYRNHHPGYATNNNRNIPSKTWTENNSNDLMPPYGQASPHSQMMNNPTQMPVTAMRSPPHTASNMNQTPQGQQHFRQMQSPAHSPHSWSQAQIPSPGMMHSSRTSPLPAHVRSPGQSQPFSPPAAHSMNIQPHLPPQENGQIPQSMNSSSGSENHNAGNPLHSLQKMVLLDQDSKAMMPLSSDGNEQFPNQCGPHNYGPEECTSNEPKDSQYSTYYNMDENRFESKPNSAANDTSVYTPVHQMTNCNYPVPSHPSNNEIDVTNVPRVHDNVNPNIAGAFHANSNQNSVPPQIINSALEHPQCKSNIPQNDCSLKQNECPPHAESAPVFTDQTKAAVSTNSEQALESKLNTNWISDAPDPEKASVAQVSYADTGTPHSSVSQEQCSASESSNNSSKVFENSTVNNESSCKDRENYTLTIDKDLKSESNSEKHNQEATNPSIGTPSSESQDCDSNITSSDSKSSSCEDSQGTEKKLSLRHRRRGVSYEENLSPETESKINSQFENWSPEKKSARLSSNQNDIELISPARNPVKVVIHRIRKNDADDTWHVPGSTSKSSETKIKKEISENVSESKSHSGGPQIIMLSQAVSEKNTGSQNSNSSNCSTDDSQNIDKDTPLLVTVKTEPTSLPEKRSSSSSIDKKRGRPVGSKNKMKSNVGKNKRGKKGMKKRKNDNSKQKVVETVTKVKKIKNFAGPFVRITGSKENPSSIAVVNVAQKEEEKLSKTQTKRTVSSAVNRIKSKTVGHLSTLSPTYDAYNRDKTWVCVFCQKGSHHGGLGDLYGPYYIKDNSEEKSSPSSSTGTIAVRNKRKKSESDDSKTPKRAKQLTPTSCLHNADDADLSEPTREVWLHEDCAVWCQSITLIGEDVRGLDEAVMEANENKCCRCAFHGATLGCWGKGCKEMYHYTCAKEIGCLLDIEKFSLLCLKHQKKSS